MRNSVITFFGLIFIALVIGLIFNATQTPFPFIEQVSDPDASVFHASGNQGVLLAILVVVVTLSVGGMAAFTYAIMWLLNREVTRVSNQPNQPLELLSFRTGGSTASPGTESLLADNVVILVIVGGVVMLLAAIVAFVAF